MDEREILNKIAESAQNLKVPDALKPEQVKQQLAGSSQKNHKRKWYAPLAAAACLCLCFGLGALAYQNHIKSQAQAGYKEAGTDSRYGQNQSGGQEDVQPAGTKEDETDADEAFSQADNSTDAEHTALPEEQPLKKIGKMYTLASDYGEVYDVLKKTENIWNERKEAAIFGADEAEYVSGSLDMAADDMQAAKTESTREFSSTNLQTEGVDESDIIKTDGSYLYAVHKKKMQIQILDIRNGMPKKAAVIRPKLDEDTDSICEMYVADARLTLIAQCEETELKENENFLENGTDDTSPGGSEGSAKKDFVLQLSGEDMQYIDTQAVTKVISYDISDPLKPVLQDESVQDGWYQTSRKIENKLYLFTSQSLRIADNMERKEAIEENAVGLWMPCVNGIAVSADRIYLPQKGNNGMIMSSFDLAEHQKVLETKMLIHNSAQLYVTRRSVYLYYSDYTNGAVKTRIARFSLESDGTIRAKAAKTLKGRIEDTFAIYERDSYLQVLTSVTSSDPWENRVYVLDENMETAGKLTGLAEGEQIYSARFAGNIGYFVTYRNTDPLFTVDFTDPENPKVIGELKVTGFSDYLHFWSDDRLLGIGLETNPDSGETVGVKLSMFDISNPAKVTEEAKIVIKGAQDCKAMRDYKSVLADLNKNVITLITESYHEKFQEDFYVFSYENGKFVEKAVRPLAAGNKDYEECTWRSLYAGDTLYLASEKKVIAFDMKNAWSEIGKLVY